MQVIKLHDISTFILLHIDDLIVYLAIFITLLQLKLWEEKARDRVRRKIESRRQYLMKIRDKNRERRMHLNSVRQSQGMTRPWVYSYYVHWTRDTYEKRLPSKKKDGRRMKPKPPPKPPGDDGQGGEGSKMADTGA